MSAETEFVRACEVLGIDPRQFEMEQVSQVNPRLHGLDLREDGTPANPDHYFTWLLQQLREANP